MSLLPAGEASMAIVVFRIYRNENYQRLKMKKVPFFCILMILFSFGFARGQEITTASINPEDPSFREKFSHLNFDGQFYILAVKDAVNNYYMADFTRFPEKFERVYFINLVYKSGKIVNIDNDLSQNRVWFLVNNKYSGKEAGTEFDQLRDQTLKAATTLTAEEKANWMLKNDKFK
jgi:hypothetical protein